MAYIVKIDDKEFKCDIEKLGNSYAVSLNGKNIQVEIAGIDKDAITLIINNRPYQITIGKENKITVDRDEYTFEVVDEKIARVLKIGADAIHKKETTVTAPMSGLVIEIEVKEGDTVRKGQGLLIIEAMKMQNEFKAPGEGIIKKIFVQKGQTVNSKDKLIIIE